MFTVYIRNYFENGVIQPKETIMYRVPEMDPDIFIESPVTKGEMGKSESFDFSLQPQSPWYRKIRHHLTIIRIQYDRDTIFFGRVLDYSTDPFGKRSYHCEGGLAFLLDSYQSPSKESKRKQTDALTWMKTMIDKHNEQVGENAWKRITLGEVPGQYTSASLPGQRVESVPERKYGTDTWQESMSCFEELVSDNGGYLKTRYENQNGNEILYLDWYRDYYRLWDDSMAPIEVGVNLIEESSKVNIQNLFTVLIPYGSKHGSDFHINHLCWPDQNHPNVPEMTVPELITEGLYTEDELTNPYYPGSIFRTAIEDYGIIYKVQKFENAKNPVELFNFAKDWIKNNYRASIITMNVKALDLHLIGEAANQYRVGDQIKIIYRDPETDALKEQMLCVMSIQYDLQNPDNNSYTLGIPDNPYNKKYGTKQNGGGGGGGTNPPNAPSMADKEVQQKFIDYVNAIYMNEREDAGLDLFGEPEKTVGEWILPVGKVQSEIMPDSGYNPKATIRVSDVDPVKEEQAATNVFHGATLDGLKCGYADIYRVNFREGVLPGLSMYMNGDITTYIDPNSGTKYQIRPQTTTNEHGQEYISLNLIPITDTHP